MTAPLLDTHAWIGWVQADARLGKHTIAALDALAPDDRPSLPAICLWEVAMLVHLGHLDLGESLRSWLDEPRNQALLGRLRDAGLRMEVPESERAADAGPKPLAGKTYVITGTLTSMSREQATAALERLGAKVAGSVSKKTTAVFVGDEAGSKADKAKALGVPLLAEADLLALIPDL